MQRSNATPETTRRKFLQQGGSLALGTAVLGSLAPRRACRRGQHDPPGPDRLRRARHRAPSATPCPCPTAARSSCTPWPTCRRTRSPRRTTRSRRQFRGQGRRAAGPPVRRLRRLPQGDRRRSGPATSPCAPRGPTSGRCTSSTPSRRASTCSWRSRSRPIRAACTGCSARARRRRRRA